MSRRSPGCAASPAASVWPSHPQRVEVGLEATSAAVGRAHSIVPPCRGEVDDPIVDVGDVHHPRHLSPDQAGTGAAGRRTRTSGSCRYGRAVDGRSAAVYADGPASSGLSSSTRRACWAGAAHARRSPTSAAALMAGPCPRRRKGCRSRRSRDTASVSTARTAAMPSRIWSSLAAPSRGRAPTMETPADTGRQPAPAVGHRADMSCWPARRSFSRRVETADVAASPTAEQRRGQRVQRAVAVGVTDRRGAYSISTPPSHSPSLRPNWWLSSPMPHGAGRDRRRWLPSSSKSSGRVTLRFGGYPADVTDACGLQQAGLVGEGLLPVSWRSKAVSEQVPSRALRGLCGGRSVAPDGATDMASSSP